MTQIINGKDIANQIDRETTEALSMLLVTPRLAIVLINPDKRSRLYVELKLAKASELGINVDVHDWTNEDPASYETKMTELANETRVNGIIVQLPAPGEFDLQKLLDLIPTSKDVDGLSSNSLDAIRTNQNSLMPATPKAIIEVLLRSVDDLIGKKILVVGQGKLVGEPLALILANKGYQVQTADSTTADLASLCKQSDVIISAVGKSNLINASMIKTGAVVIDAGISEVGGKMTGDINYDGMDGIASAIAKVPGGVGPVTVSCLLHNVAIATKNSQ